MPAKTKAKKSSTKMPSINDRLKASLSELDKMLTPTPAKKSLMKMLTPPTIGARIKEKLAAKRVEFEDNIVRVGRQYVSPSLKSMPQVMTVTHVTDTEVQFSRKGVSGISMMPIEKFCNFAVPYKKPISKEPIVKSYFYCLSDCKKALKNGATSVRLFWPNTAVVITVTPDNLRSVEQRWKSDPNIQ